MKGILQENGFLVYSICHRSIYFQSNSVMNSLKCPKSKSLSHCLTELLQIYQNKHWTIKRRDDCSVDPLSHRLILKIVGFWKDECKHVVSNIVGQNRPSFICLPYFPWHENVWIINMWYNREYMITMKYQKAHGQLRQHYKNRKIS